MMRPFYTEGGSLAEFVDTNTEEDFYEHPVQCNHAKALVFRVCTCGTDEGDGGAI
jgi:hypothetical protein